MRKNIFVIFLLTGLFLLWGATKTIAVGPDEEELKGTRILHSMAPDSSLADDDSLVRSMSGIVSTWWIQFASCFNVYHIEDYIDNGDGKLSACDYIRTRLHRNLITYGNPNSGWRYFSPADTNNYKWRHVDSVTITLKLRRMGTTQDTIFADRRGGQLDTTFYPAYWDTLRAPWYLGSDTVYIDSATTDSLHQNPASYLRKCIWVKIRGNGWWHVEDKATDIFLTTKKPVPTMTQWGLIVLVVLLIASAVFVALKRRKVAVPA